MAKDLGYLCNGLVAMGVPEEELRRISSEYEVSCITRPGTKAYELIDIAKVFGGLVIGATIGALVGYKIFNDFLAAFFGGAIGACGGMCGINDGEEREHWMRQDLEEGYSHLVAELEKNKSHYKKIV